MDFSITKKKVWFYFVLKKSLQKYKAKIERQKKKLKYRKENTEALSEYSVLTERDFPAA